MNKRTNYFLAICNRIGEGWGYIKGKALLVVISAIAGIIAPYSSFHWISLTLILLFISFVFYRFHPFSGFLCCIVLLTYLGLFLILDDHNKSTLKASTVNLTATVIVPPVIDDDRLTLIMKTKSNEKVKLTYSFRTQIERKKKAPSYKMGMVCTFDGVLVKPEVARNPDSFDYKKYLYEQKIHWIFKPKSLQPENCKTKKVYLNGMLYQIRQAGIMQIQKYFSGSTAGIVQALIYGERKNISDDVLRSYQALGIIHLLAISGLHVSLLTAMFYFLCIRVGITHEATVNILLCLLPVYMIIAGASPSVVRSCLMSILVLVSIKWFGKMGLLDVISISCMVMLAFNPYLLFNIGFQLSYIVSLALILSSSLIIKRYNHFLASLFVVSYLAQLSSIPIILYHFYEFSLLSLPLNMVYVPLYSLILPVALFALLMLAIFEPFGAVIAKVLTMLLNVVNHFALYLSEIPYTKITLGEPNYFFLLLYIFLSILILYKWESKNTFFHWSQLCLLLVFVIHGVSPYVNPSGEVTVIDVGQGDSILIELPFRKGVYLIDTGGIVTYQNKKLKPKGSEFSTGKDIIIPLLKSKGIRHIDKLIITHGDQDHIGGAKELLEGIPTNSIMLGKSGKDSSLEDDIKAIARKRGIHVEVVKGGDKWLQGGYPFYILSPSGRETSENDNSIVLYTKLGGMRWLFMGDLEKEGEQRILTTYKGLHTDIVKVGHHGSNTSTTEEFLKQLHPKFALISVGKNNHFNHPHPEVMHRLLANKIRVFRTDQDGAVQFRFRKNSGTFYTTIP